MKRCFSKKLSKGFRVFGGISKRLVPYAGVKRVGKNNSQSVTISPMRKTGYTKNKIGQTEIKAKIDLDTGFVKPKVRWKK